MDVNGIVKLDFFINADSDENIFQGAQEVLSVIRPQWQTINIMYKVSHYFAPHLLYITK